MPIDVATDELIGLEVVAKRFPDSNGKPKVLKSIMRWILNGVKATHASEAIKLEAKRVGGTWYTTEDAIRRFADALTGRSLAEPYVEKKSKTPVAKTARHRRAMAKLKARGMCK